MLNKSRNKSYIEIIVAELIIAAVFLIICKARNIYPFGNQYLVNFTDFKAQSVPIYMHVWDALHGKADFFFDWRFGLGSNFSGTISHYSLLSPFSLFFFFVQREQIMASMIWFILLKLLCAGITMFVFLKKDTVFFQDKRLSSSWIVVGSVAYALNGYTMQYYGFPWLDVAVFFPLLMLSLNNFLVSNDFKFKKAELLYTVLLALELIINIPQAYAVCLFLIGYICGYLFLVCKDTRIRAVVSLKIAVLSVLGLLLSLAVFLPGAYHISHSYRMQYGNYGSRLQSYITMMDLPKQEVFRKNGILLGVIVPLFVSATSLLYVLIKKKTESWYCFKLYLLFMVCSPVFFESVNGIYHNGPYSCYPMRYGFLTSFIIIIIGLHSISGFVLNSAVEKSSRIILQISWLCVIVFFAGNNIEASDSYDYHEYLSDISSLRNGVMTDRVKLTDSSMLENYPLYLNLPSLSNYVPLNSYEIITFAQQMGYAQDWVRLEDAGGTLFSDALLGINNRISTVSDGLYSKNETPITLFANKLNNDHVISISSFEIKNPTGLFITASDFSSFSSSYCNSPFDSQNSLSKLLFNTSFFHKETEHVSDVSENNLSIPTSGNEALYFWSDNLKNIILEMDGEPVRIPGRNRPDNMIYPVEGNNGIIPLGSYPAGIHSLVISSTDGNEINGDYEIGHLDLDQYISSINKVTGVDNLSFKKHSFSCSYTSDSDGFVIFPVYADKGWHCRVNDQTVEIESIFGVLMAVPVTEGENTITLNFSPPYQKAGVGISIFALLLLILLFLLRNTERMPFKLSDKLINISLAIVWVIYLCYVYIIPIVFRLGMSFYKRLF